MKTFLIGIYLLFPILLVAQSPRLNIPDSSSIKSQSIHRDTVVPERKYNAYGYLLNNDTLYNYKYHWLTPSLRVLASNGFNWTLACYFLKADWASNGPKNGSVISKASLNGTRMDLGLIFMVTPMPVIFIII